jgi:pantoate--beta-alanine ligase
LKIVRSVAEMATLGGGDLGFVPTMGAFHKGHITLMEEARRHHATVCVSLFVNPLQFGPNEDLAKYPRDESRDFALAEEARVDIVFAPTQQEIYPRPSTVVEVPELTNRLEGAVRPGHFDGVATVVAKLFNIVRPRIAYFGWKDLQQCLVIRRMVEDLNMAVHLEYLETVREPDGLAMSSRNAYLNARERQTAPLLFKTITSLARSFEGDGGDMDLALEASRRELSNNGFSVDYLDLVSLRDLQPIRTTDNAAIVVAARLGSTRLIDNCRLRAK